MGKYQRTSDTQNHYVRDKSSPEFRAYTYRLAEAQRSSSDSDRNAKPRYIEPVCRRVQKESRLPQTSQEPRWQYKEPYSATAHQSRNVGPFCLQNKSGQRRLV